MKHSVLKSKELARDCMPLIADFLSARGSSDQGDMDIGFLSLPSDETATMLGRVQKCGNTCPKSQASEDAK